VDGGDEDDLHIPRIPLIILEDLVLVVIVCRQVVQSFLEELVDRLTPVLLLSNLLILGDLEGVEDDRSEEIGHAQVLLSIDISWNLKRLIIIPVVVDNTLDLNEIRRVVHLKVTLQKIGQEWEKGIKHIV
jgi:hypothetical protein